jgi:selenocysteine-specific elongation factor
VAVNLSRLKPADVPRGALLSSDGSLCLSRRFGVELRVLPGAEGELVPGRSLIVHLGTARVPGRIVWRTAGVAELRLERPLPAAAGLCAVLRSSSKRGAFGRVLGGALVLDADAEGARGKAQREITARAWTALAAGSVAEGLGGLVRARAPRTLSIATLEQRVGLEPGSAALQLQRELERGEIVSSGERLALGASLAELVDLAAAELARFHERAPHAAGLSRETLRDVLLRRSDAALAELVLTTLLEGGRAAARAGGLIALPRVLAQGAEERNVVRQRVAERLRAAGLEGADEREVSAAAEVSEERARAALGELARSEQARRLGSLWFDEAALEGLRQRVRQHFSRKPTLSVPELKALAGVSRKQAIPLLEQLDREGTTRRKGDDRVAGTRPER